MAGLKLEHIYKVYPNGTKAVSDFSMEIQDKEFIVFVGPSGCGKSTTLRMIAGLEDISAGELYIDDTIVNDVEPKDRDIAMVFQNYALYPHMTVYENMAFGLKLRHVPNAEIHEKVLWAAKVLDLTEYLDRKPKAMSGGQRQRVALGRAILRNPKVMLLDEPLSNLDAKLRSQMRSEIAKLHDELKTTFIYVTHDQVEAMTLGTRVVVMKLGRIMQIDTPKNLYDYPDNLFVAGFIGTPQMNFFHAYLSREKSDINVSFKWSENSFKVSQALMAKVKPQYFDGKSEVIVGLRCENLSFEPDIVNKAKYLMDVRISHFEELGNETLIYGDINMQGDGFSETATRVIVKGTSTYGFKKGDIKKCAIDVSKMHLFDIDSEKTINPRIPEENLISCTVSNGQITIGGKTLSLPNAIKVDDGNYDLLFPTSAVTIVKNDNASLKVDVFEKIDNINLVGVGFDNQLIFSQSNEEMNIGSGVDLEIDFTNVKFIKDNKVVFDAVPEYDKINAIFMNHLTAKSFIGDKYDSVLKARENNVRNHYDPILKQLTDTYNKEHQEAEKVNSKTIVLKNELALEESKKNRDLKIAEAKKEYNEKALDLKNKHQDKNAQIVKDVDALYDKIKNDEISAFEQFKLINKDKDAYRKRAQELREFKGNLSIEKKNELDKRLNLEAVAFESDLNALKGACKRKITSYKKEHSDLVDRCNNEAYPLKKIEKEYKKNLKAINNEYQQKINIANIVFFFKTNNFVTLSSDAISNKMIQGLGINVFTKQYLIEIPHDAYIFADEGLELTVIENLDYGKKKFVKCAYTDDFGTSDVYILTDKEITDKKVIVRFDISKVHITEKSMDIKIY